MILNAQPGTGAVTDTKTPRSDVRYRGILVDRKLVVRGRVELPTFRFSGGRSYQLSYLTQSGPDGT